jgi:hypothetical protein
VERVEEKPGNECKVLSIWIIKPLIYAIDHVLKIGRRAGFFLSVKN